MNILNGIIRFSLKNRLFVLLGVVLIVTGGISAWKNMDIDVFPDLTAPTVTIISDAHGMSSEEVERLVTFPIETAVNGATGVRRVRSASMFGSSFVWVEFNWDMDVFRARQIVSEKMSSLVEQLPAGITPRMAPQSSVMGEILFIGLQAADSLSGTTPMDLNTLAEWVVKPEILATGGVAEVTVLGGDRKQYQVLADPARMEAYGVTMGELEQTVRTMSANSEGGVIREYGNEYSLRGIGRTTELAELGHSFVKLNDGNPITVEDVADVTIGSAVKLGYASQNAKPAVILAVTKQPNINTLKVTRAIEKNLQGIKLPDDVTMDTGIFRQADFIEASVGNVGRALIEGAVFVIIILFLFLGNFRTTLISIFAIPLSLLATTIILRLLGMDINTMTLGGMCIAIGSLVDDAIIDVENVYKRLRQNHSKPERERLGAFEVVFEGSREIRTSVIYATLIIMLAFMPLFFLSGMEGRLLKPLGITYIISLFMSLIVAMTVTPLLCKDMLAKDSYLDKNDKEGLVSRILNSFYKKSLLFVLSHKKAAIALTSLMLLGAAGIYFTMGSSFLPDFNEGSMTITAVTSPGVSVEVSNELGNIMEKELLSIPEVTGTARRTGRGELSEHSQSTNGAEIDVNYKLAGRSKEELFNDCRKRLGALPGVVVTIGQPLGHRIDHMLSGTKAAIAIKIFGPDLSTLLITGNKIKDLISDIEGVVDVNVEQQTASPQLQIRAKRDVLANYGISMAEFNDFVTMAFSGAKIADIYEGQRRFDLVLRLVPEYTGSVEGVRNALIDTGLGGKVPLSQLAEIVSSSGPNSISRENVQRKLLVSANSSGRDVVSVVEDIKKAVGEQISLEEGYRIEYGGQFESARTASRTLAFATILSLMMIFLLLFMQFRKLSLSFIVLFSLPLALIGGMFAVRLSSGIVSIPAIIGFITLFGIATRNGVLLISRYQTLREEGENVRDTVLCGSADRLNPILMTALTSALALIPLVLNGDKSGNEIQSPMAIVVLGGLITSTLLNIYIMPVIYEWYETRKKNRS